MKEVGADESEGSVVGKGEVEGREEDMEVIGERSRDLLQECDDLESEEKVVEEAIDWLLGKEGPEDSNNKECLHNPSPNSTSEVEIRE